MSLITIINGKFQDPAGGPLALGSLVFTLSHDGQEPTDPGQVVAGLTKTVALDSNGNVPASPVIQLWANSELTPSGSYYTLTAYTAGGQQVYQQYIIIPDTSPYDLGNIIPVNPGGCGYGGSGGGGGGSSITLQVNGTNNASQTLLNFVNSGSVSFTNPSGGIVTATASGGGGGGVSGSGTAGVIPIWATTTSLGNSGLADNGSGSLTYQGSSVVLSTNLAGGEATVAAATGSGATPGGPVVLNAGNGSSTSHGGGIFLNAGSSLTDSEGSAPIELNGSNVGAGNAGEILIRGGGCSGGTGLAGSILLQPGLGNSNTSLNGAVSIGTGVGFEPFVTYLGVCSFANLPTPPNNPVTTNNHGALLFCTDAKGSQDSVSWGSTAVGSGTGAVVKFTGSVWVVIG